MQDTIAAVYTYAGVFFAYILIMIVGVYFGSRVKAKKERELMEKKLAQQAAEDQKQKSSNTSQKAVAPEETKQWWDVDTLYI